MDKPKPKTPRIRYLTPDVPFFPGNEDEYAKSWQDWFDLCENPKAELILEHTERLLTSAEDDSPLARTWENLQMTFEDASRAVKENDFHAACLYFYLMGETTERLRWPDPAFVEITTTLSLEAAKRRKPLMRLNKLRSLAKQLVLKIADKKWQEDLEEKIRISEMAGIVWAEFVEKIPSDHPIMDGLPDNAEGLKPWLRENSPDYAKKPGRPPKK